jgi:hypothetical protein
VQLFVVQSLVGISVFLLNSSHTALAYSMDGLASVVYAASLTTFGHACMLRLRKPMVRLALAVMLLM